MGQISFLGHVETSPLFVIHLFEIRVQMYGPQWRTGAARSGDQQQSSMPGDHTLVLLLFIWGRLDNA